MNGTRRRHDYADAQGIETGEMDLDDLQLLVACVAGWAVLTGLALAAGLALGHGIRWLLEVLP